VVNLAVLGCVLRATTKKVVNNFREKKVHPREIPRYAYGISAELVKLTLGYFVYSSPNFTGVRKCVRKCEIWPRFSTAAAFETL